MLDEYLNNEDRVWRTILQLEDTMSQAIGH